MIVTCRTLVELATDYQEGALTGPRRAVVRAHLVYCVHCRTYLSQLAATAQALGRLGGDGGSEGLDAAPLLARLRARRAGARGG